MNKTLVGLLFLVLIGLAGIWYSERAPQESTHITIGVIAPLSGDFAPFGEQIRDGILSVPHEGINFVFEDEKCDTTPAVSALHKLTAVDGAHFILGPACGSPQEAIAPILQGRDILAVVPSAASTDLFQESGGNIYDIQYSLQDESKFMAEQMYARGYKRVALISYANAYSKVHHDAFVPAYKGTIVQDTVFVLDTSDISTEITKLKSKDFDALYVIDASFFFAQGMQKLKEFGIDKPVFAPYTVEMPAIRPLAEGVIYSFPADVSDTTGGIYTMAKQSAETLVPLVSACKGEYTCVKAKMDASGAFDANGVKIRSLVLKQLKGGEPTLYP